MRSRSFIPLGLSLILILSCSTGAKAAQMVWSGLVIATNVSDADAIPQELHPIEGELKALFGYNQFKVIGQSRKTLVSGSEDWLAQSKYFSLRVDSKGETSAGYLLNVKLFQEEKLLLETEAKLSRRPLVIKGPLVGDGQLLLVLFVQ